MSEERTKYQKEWDQYRNRSANGCLGAIVLFLVAAAVMIVSGMYPAVSDFLQKAAFFIFAALVAFALVIGLQYRRWKCPRCGDSFQGWRRHMPRFCLYCGLPKYYGSAYFYDNWGTGEGKSLAERVEKGDLKVNEG